MTINAERRRRFREVLAGQACVRPASVHDPLTARMAEALGYEVGMLAGSVASLTVLGAPDLTVLTLSEFAGLARRICRAGALPLLVDADHGYGNGLNVMRAVEELETAGVAAMTLEDTLLPRAFGEAPSGLISLEEGLGKIAAALAARDDPEFCIVARTSALALAGLDEAVRRARAYGASGADAIFFTGVATRAELDALAGASGLPIILSGAPGPELDDVDVLASRGVRIALQSHQPFREAAEAAYATLKSLRDGASAPPGSAAEQVQRLKVFSREADYADWTRRFLGSQART